jgi:hypothetical protein
MQHVRFGYLLGGMHRPGSRVLWRGCRADEYLWEPGRIFLSHRHGLHRFSIRLDVGVDLGRTRDRRQWTLLVGSRQHERHRRSQRLVVLECRLLNTGVGFSIAAVAAHDFELTINGLDHVGGRQGRRQ